MTRWYGVMAAQWYGGAVVWRYDGTVVWGYGGPVVDDMVQWWCNGGEGTAFGWQGRTVAQWCRCTGVRGRDGSCGFGVFRGEEGGLGMCG